MEKVIYTRWLAIKLIKAGFPVVRVEQNPDKPQFDCWIFAETPEFKKSVCEYGKLETIRRYDK